MSIKVMNDVWKESNLTGNDRLLLLAIADNADEEHRVAWPSVATLVRKTRIPRRTIFRCIKRCVAAGELSYDPGGMHKSNHYKVLVQTADGGGGGVKVALGGVVPSYGTGVVPSYGTGVVPSYGTLTVIEPSVKPSKNKKEVVFSDEAKVLIHRFAKECPWYRIPGGKVRLRELKAAAEMLASGETADELIKMAQLSVSDKFVGSRGQGSDLFHLQQNCNVLRAKLNGSIRSAVQANHGFGEVML